MNDSVKHPSPPLLLLAAVHTIVLLSGLIASTALAGGTHFPSPFDPDAARDYFAVHASAVRVGAFLLFGCAVPLGLFAASASSRLAFLGVRAAGVNIGFFGGSGAALMLLVSGLCMWCLAQPGVGHQPEAARLLHLLAFATGGPGFAVAFGLLALGLSLAGGLSGHLPRWLMWLGIVIGILGELSSLSLVLTPAALLLPLTRFPGLIWLLGVGATLHTRRELDARRLESAPAAARAG